MPQPMKALINFSSDQMEVKIGVKSQDNLEPGASLEREASIHVGLDELFLLPLYHTVPRILLNVSRGLLQQCGSTFENTVLVV